MDVQVIDHLVQLADKYGFTLLWGTVALFLLCVILAWIARQAVKAACWLGEHFVIPIRQAAESYLAGMQEWNVRIGQNIESIRADYATHHAWEEEKATADEARQERILDILSRRHRRPGSHPDIDNGDA